jgi:hypothetical protein
MGGSRAPQCAQTDTPDILLLLLLLLFFFFGGFGISNSVA